MQRIYSRDRERQVRIIFVRESQTLGFNAESEVCRVTVECRPFRTHIQLCNLIVSKN